MAKIGAALVAALMLIVSWRVIGRMASRFLRFWRALPLLGKIVLPVCLTVFYLHGSTKQKGAPKADGAFAVSSSQNIVPDEAQFVQPLHRYLAPTNFAADLSIFTRPTNAVTPRLWKKYSIIDDFQLVPGKRIAGVCGAVTTQPWGIDTPDRIKDIYETYAPLYSTNALIRGVSDFWTVTNEFSQTYVWKDLAHKCNKTNLTSFAVTLYDWGDIEFTYGNVPTDGFTSFVKLKDKTLDLTGNVAPNRTVRIEKNFEQDTEWWLENYPEICYTNATGDLVFDYDTNEWIYVEFTFSATEPMAEYTRDLNDYRKKIAAARGSWCLICDDDEVIFTPVYFQENSVGRTGALNERYDDMNLSELSFLKGYEYMLDDYGKDSMSPELLKKYEPLFNTVTNIRDASVVEYVTFTWDGKNSEDWDQIFDKEEKEVDFKKFPSLNYYDKKAKDKFITPWNFGIVTIEHYLEELNPLVTKERLKFTKNWGLDYGKVTNYYKVVYCDPYLMRNILGPRPNLDDYIQFSSLSLKRDGGKVISPEFNIDFPIGTRVKFEMNGHTFFDIENRPWLDNEGAKKMGAFIKAGYVYVASASSRYSSVTNPGRLIDYRRVAHPTEYVYKMTPKHSMSLENVDFSFKNWVNAKAKITPELKHGSYTWSISDNLEMIKSAGNQAAILRKNGESGWVKCVWDNGDKAFWNLRMSNTVQVASNKWGFDGLPKFLSITPSSSFIVCPEEHLDKNGNLVNASGTNVMLTCSYGGQQDGTVELRLDYDLAGEVYENGVRRQLPYAWEVPGGQVTTKTLEIRDLWPSGEYKFNLLFTSEKLPEGFMQQASVRVMKLDVEADRTWPEMRKRYVFGPNEPFTVTVDDDSETKIVASKVPGTYTTNVTCNGYSIPFSYSVIAPSHCIATNAYPMADSDWAEVGITNPLSVGEVGAGMCLELKLLPEHVSFEGLKVMEGECSATRIRGYFSTFDMSNVRHNASNGALKQIVVQQENFVGVDRAGWARRVTDLPTPWSYGSYEWQIPFYWSADDFATTNRFATNVQEFELLSSNGDFVVRKFGWKAQRDTDGNQTVTRDVQ